MSGEFPSSPRAPGRINRPNPRGLVVLLGTSAVVALIVVGICLASTGLTTGRSEASVLSLRSSSLPPAAAPFSVVNLTANNTTVDVSMAFNVSVDVVNLTGGALNASNFTFVWAGLPVFVPGTPGSGCYGLNPDNNSSVLNCTAASSGALTVSVTATNYTSSQSNVSTSLSIQVNVLPTESAFTVSTSGIAATDHVSVAVNASISFSVTASGGTAPLSYSVLGPSARLLEHRRFVLLHAESSGDLQRDRHGHGRERLQHGRDERHGNRDCPEDNDHLGGNRNNGLGNCHRHPRGRRPGDGGTSRTSEARRTSRSHGHGGSHPAVFERIRRVPAHGRLTALRSSKLSAPVPLATKPRQGLRG